MLSLPPLTNLSEVYGSVTICFLWEKKLLCGIGLNPASSLPLSLFQVPGARWDEHSSGKVTDVREHPQAKLSTDTPLLG